ncbi:mycofactocin biosynthesis peptidyl-dipeptidase MftE [Pseudonocardia spinosispora]|uniref:mycofactocin biosynthesis peptidyl-dipeptidase MftE n=1 Tax=Pseudonocardia spinosispora TaxID=103441 RepID=UPI000402DDC0|nr:mycofactocin biosynthesis peptidyl-dipeptidase MftE [Pseudonocardia spinosispora]
MSLGARTWPELDGAPATLLVPVGACEQHGPHLPLDTDTRIAEAVAVGVAERLGVGTLVAPPVGFGASGEHEMFAGTVSIGQEALRAVLVELGRSAGRWVSRLVFVNGHGGNVLVLRDAVELLRAEGRDVRWYGCALPRGAGFVQDGHAGRTETSIMLALAPEQVRLERAEAGNTAPIAELLPAMRAGGVRSVSENGVLGDPAGASAEEGHRMLAALVEACVQFVG